MEILNSRQMGAADKYTIDTIGIPSAVLMENAAKGILDVINRLDMDILYIAIYAGSGNNGGDGITLARRCFDAGYNVSLYLTVSPERLKGDSLLNYNVLKHYPVKIFDAFHDSPPEKCDLLVDSIFGTGLSRPLEGKYKNLINILGALNVFKLSVDIPSGLSGNTSEVIGDCLNADATVTMCRPKIPHKLYPAKKYCGKVEVVDISIPDFAVQKTNPCVYELNKNNIGYLTKREPDSHKGDFGHAVLIGGSPGKTGAPLLASGACLRCGAGLTTSVLPSKLNLTAEMGSREVMSYPVGSGEFFTDHDSEETLKFIADKSVAAIGPGIGREKATTNFVSSIIKNSNIPLVIDADGLFNIADKDFENLRYRCIITPHIGEFARIINQPKKDIINNKIECAYDFSVKHGIVTVLKSADTVVAVPDGTVYVINSGTPALAKGGSGDCLTGIITSFTSQGFSLKMSALLGPWIMGRTSEHLSDRYSERYIITSDIIENLWTALNDLYRI